MNMGYLMEQMVLYLCSIGLGTCYIGSRRVRRELQEKDGKKLVGIIAFGKSKGPWTRKPSEANRLAMDELCVFKEVPRQWMKQLLEAARLAPSSMNSQPWRFVVYDNRIHIFSKKHSAEQLKKWDEVNFGIMFANLMVCRRGSLAGCGSHSSGRYLPEKFPQQPVCAQCYPQSIKNFPPAGRTEASAAGRKK